MMNRLSTTLCIVVAAAATAFAFVPPKPVALRPSFVSLHLASSNENDNIFQKAWKRMDTLEAAGINDEFAANPPLMSRGGGFKRFMVIMAFGVAYKWYRARFINKVR